MTAPFRLDSSYRRHGNIVIAGSPLRLFRLSAGGRGVAEAVERGGVLPAHHQPLTERLVEAGAIHPAPTGSLFTAADVTVVVPAFNVSAGQLHHDGPIIVVDDGSDPRLTAALHHRLIRLSPNAGPAAARNAGLAAATTSLVAFVDTDVDTEQGWLDTLLPHFNDPRLAVVAPRVRSASGSSVLAAYEAARSPLDLGSEPARIATGTRVSYLPAAALVARVDALRAVGGFDESMRVGEDVDLIWRLIESGYRCRYEPVATVTHRPRATLAAWTRQRVGYGRSAAALDHRHPGAVAPLRIGGWSVAVWALVIARRPWAAAAVAAGTTVALRRKLDDLPASESLRLAGLGHLYAGRQLANAATRVWWPPALLAAALLPRARLPLAAAALAPALVDWAHRRGPLDPLRYTALRLADDAAYGAGVWFGVIGHSSARALLPRFTNWPGKAAD
jgi:mycofactocin glycosyltransferase